MHSSPDGMAAGVILPRTVFRGVRRGGAASAQYICVVYGLFDRAFVLPILLGAGFLLGSRETLLETKDGGRTWSPRSVAAAQDEGVLATRLCWQ